MIKFNCVIFSLPDINELASDQQYSKTDQIIPLQNTILVNDKKKIDDRKKLMSTIEKKNKAKGKQNFLDIIAV